MLDAPECPKGCGPLVVPGHPEYTAREGWVWCAACGHDYESEEDYARAVRAEDEYLALEGVKEAQERQVKRTVLDRQALADWNEWAAQHK